jgi:hypothetical protein
MATATESVLRSNIMGLSETTMLLLQKHNRDESDRHCVGQIQPFRGSNLHTFVMKNNYGTEAKGVTAATKAKWTHLIMSGESNGGFAIPLQPEIYDRFLYHYVLDLNQHKVHYVSERRTPDVFKLHFDFDIKRQAAMTLADVVQLIKDLDETVAMFYPTTTSLTRFDMVVCAVCLTGKSGIHVTFPHLYVNALQAIEIRNTLVQRLLIKYGDMQPIQNSWEDIVDASIYAHNGLRMVGSHKPAPCNACGGAKKRDKATLCKECLNFGKQDVGRDYRPWFYWAEHRIHEDLTRRFHGNLNEVITIHGQKRRLIEMCCTVAFVHEPSSDFEFRGSGVLTMVSDHKNSSSITSSQTKRKPVLSTSPQKQYKPLTQIDGSSNLILAEDYAGMQKVRRKEFVDINAEGCIALQNFMQSSAFPDFWRQLIIRDVYTNPNNTYYVVNVKGENSRLCLNYQSQSHNSNSIYFYVTVQGMFQRCYCRCQTTFNRMYGKCADFKSQVMPLPNEIISILFPKHQTSRIGNLKQSRSVINHHASDFEMSLALTCARLDREQEEYYEKRQMRLAKQPHETQDVHHIQNPVLNQHNRKRKRNHQGDENPPAHA